jgi:hypothetical protein
MRWRWFNECLVSTTKYPVCTSSWLSITVVGKLDVIELIGIIVDYDSRVFRGNRRLVVAVFARARARWKLVEAVR